MRVTAAEILWPVLPVPVIDNRRSPHAITCGPWKSTGHNPYPRLPLSLSLARALPPPSLLPSLPLPLHRRRNFAKNLLLLLLTIAFLASFFLFFQFFFWIFLGRGNLIFSPVLCRWCDQRSSTSLIRLWSSSSFRYANEFDCWRNLRRS